MRLRTLSLLLLTACPADPDSREFRIAEPTTGASFDRCVIRARTTPPEPNASWTPGGDEGGGTLQHINYRIDGGIETEVKPVSIILENDYANVLISVKLREGANKLEIGGCDEFDLCDYKFVDVTVANTAGAPDCDGPGAGQLLVEHKGVHGATMLPDGRFVVGFSDSKPSEDATFGISRYSATGALDMTFGAMGLAPTPGFPDHIVPHADGGYLVIGAGFYMARVSAAGVLDTAYGNAGGSPGSRVMPCMDGTGCIAGAVRSDGAGGVWIAGSSSAGSYIMRLDATETITAHTLVDANGGAAVAIDETGRALFMTDTSAFVGSLAGIDTTFGTAGYVTFPASGEMYPRSGAALAGSRAVIARKIGNAFEIRTFDGATAHPVVVTPPFMHSGQNVLPGVGLDTQGRAYVSFPRDRAVEPTAYYPGIDGTETVIARVANGALDPSFGTSGISSLRYRDVWSPPSTETLADTPYLLRIGPDGAPWIFGTSYSITNSDAQPTVRKGPAVTIAKLKI